MIWVVAAATLSGCMVAAAAPPWGCVPLSWVALAPLLWAAQRVSPLRAAICGGACFVVTLLIACSWWVATLQGFAELPALHAATITLGFVVWQAFPYACWLGLCRWAQIHRGLPWLLTAPLGMAIAECTFPFFFKLHTGVVLIDQTALRQWAELGGGAAVSAVWVVINLAVIRLIEGTIARTRRRAIPSLVVLAVLLFGGHLRAEAVRAERLEAPEVEVALIECNFGQVTAERRERLGHGHVSALRRATDLAVGLGADLVVWPETSWPFLFSRRLDWEFSVGHPWSPRHDRSSHLILGALTHDFDGTENVFNSAIWFAPGGEIQSVHDKTTLVPFAEDVPLEDWWPETAASLRERCPEWPRITPGDSPANPPPLVAGLQPGMLICSEELRSDRAAATVRAGANLLVSIGSDSWFVGDAAPAQQLALARFRAIETRRDMARSVHAGFSAAIDATGGLQLERSSPTRDDGDHPQSVQPVLTTLRLLSGGAPGASLVPWFPWACLALLVIGERVVAGRRRPGVAAAPESASFK